MATEGREFWDAWWSSRQSEVEDGAYAFPVFPAPLDWNRFVNSGNPLVEIMIRYGLRTVLCAGNGVSQEPRALAAAGLDVTALDISSVAVRLATSVLCHPTRLNSYCSPKLHRPGGKVDFVVGDLLDSTVCPGPFDVIIERLTMQRFGDRMRATALEALAKRLGRVAIFVSQCLDDGFPPELGWSHHESGMFHASESWFRENGWTIWDQEPSSSLMGRVAWLIRCGSMKARPRREDDR